MTEIASSRNLIPTTDENRLAHLVRLVGAVAGDVAYSRVTLDALKSNIERLAAMTLEWRLELEKR